MGQIQNPMLCGSLVYTHGKGLGCLLLADASSSLGMTTYVVINKKGRGAP
jgi:hypothetical protein